MPIFDPIKNILPNVLIFDSEEQKRLNEAQNLFKRHLEGISDVEYKKEMER